MIFAAATSLSLSLQTLSNTTSPQPIFFPLNIYENTKENFFIRTTLSRDCNGVVHASGSIVGRNNNRRVRIHAYTLPAKSIAGGNTHAHTHTRLYFIFSSSDAKQRCKHTQQHLPLTVHPRNLPSWQDKSPGRFKG